MKSLKNHSIFISLFSFTILLYLYPLIFMRSAFLAGDYWLQFYPWSKVYSESVKSFNLPFWTRFIQSGFPLAAEGQVGVFYPLNLLLFFILPFKAAYNYSVILHFIIGGVFTYIFSRKIGIDQLGGYLASLLFCFGSAYAGCFYNIITLRTLIWFPCVLILFEEFFAKKKLRIMLLAGVIFAFQLLAGFIQMAVYSYLFYSLYFFYRAVSEKLSLKRMLFAFMSFSLLAILLSLPQLFLTLELVKFSGRGGVGLEFALWKSFSPTGLFGLIFPYSMLFTGANFYIGILSIFFVIYGFRFLKADKILRNMVLMLGLSLFLALGQFNPVYVWCLRIFKFYGFRNPTKFLFFASFALSILAGFGFSRIFSEDRQRIDSRRPLFMFRLILLGSALAFLALSLCLSIFKKQILFLGEYYVRNFIYGRANHRFGLDYYLGQLGSYYNEIADAFSFSNIFVLASLILLLICAFSLPFLLKRKLKYVAILIIFVDLFVFSFYGIGFRGNVKNFDVLVPDHELLLDKIKNDIEISRIAPLDITSKTMPRWTVPNANILYGIDSIACYSPLVNSSYRNILLNLGLIDDSLGVLPAKEGALRENLDVLKLLNVKYVISCVKQDYDFLEVLEEEDGVFLYRMKEYFPRAFFTVSLSDDLAPDKETILKLIRHDSGYAEIELENKTSGFLVLSEAFYPGWQAYVDGLRNEIIKIKGLIQGVAVGPGLHRIIFIFRPYSN